jgi:hypothetical protein
MDCFTAKVMRIQGFLIDWNQIEIRFGLGNLESVFQIQMWFFRNPIFTSQFCAARFPKVCDAASISVGLQSLWGLKESGLNCSCQNKKSAPNIDWIPTVCNNFELKKRLDFLLLWTPTSYKEITWGLPLRRCATRFTALMRESCNRKIAAGLWISTVGIYRSTWDQTIEFNLTISNIKSSSLRVDDDCEAWTWAELWWPPRQLGT